MGSFSFRSHFGGLALSALLVSCAVGPDFRSPSSPKVQNYTDTPLPKQTASAPTIGEKPQSFLLGKDIPAQWWVLFHSETLNALIQKGFAHNPTLEAAQAALRQAKENVAVGIGNAFFPAVNAQIGDQKQRTFAGIGGPDGYSTFNLLNTAVNVSYTFDVFGGARREIEALCAQVDYQRFQQEAAYLSLASNIVTTAITEASLRAQIQATQDLISSQESQLKIVDKQFQLGGVSRSDVLAQESQVAQTRASLPPLQKSLAQTRHALAALVGELPTENQLPSFYLTELQLPGDIPLSLPSLLVRQRPDVRASEALLHQASAQVGVATANLFPQFTLTGAYGWQAGALNQLFKPSTAVWNIAGQMLQPLFQGGALRAQRRAAIAAYEQAFAQYRQTVLQAFQNTADALRALEIDARTLKAQVEAEAAAEASLVLTQAQFKLGAVNYLSLLNAERTYQEAVINRIQAQAARYTDTAALFQALGGGWWNRDTDRG